MVDFELKGPTLIIRKIVTRSHRRLHNSKKKVAALLIEWDLINESGEYLQSWEPEKLFYKQIPELVRLFYDQEGFKDKFRRKFYDQIKNLRAYVKHESGDMFLVRIGPYKGQMEQQAWISRRRLLINNPSILSNLPF